MSKIKMGVIGLGMIAQVIHLPGIDRSKELELVAICDLDPVKLKSFGDLYNIDETHRFTDYHDLIHCATVDGVSICTPNDCHYQMAMDVATARKPYALEKPITMNAEEADRLAEYTKMMGVRNMICFSYRFKTAARYAKYLIASGQLGDLYHVNMQYIQSWGLPEANTPLVWRFIKERTGSGALGDLGCHGLDLVRFVTGKEYLKVVSQADTLVKERRLIDGEGIGISNVDDFCNFLALMEDKISASFQITRFGYGRGNYQRMEVYGSKGALVYKLDETAGVDEIEVCIGPTAAQNHAFSKVTVPEQFEADQMQSFANIINESSDGFAATIEDGRLNQRVVDAIIQSFEEERWIKL